MGRDRLQAPARLGPPAQVDLAQETAVLPARVLLIGPSLQGAPGPSGPGDTLLLSLI